MWPKVSFRFLTIDDFQALFFSFHIVRRDKTCFIHGILSSPPGFNTKCKEQRKFKNCKGKSQVKHEGRPISIIPDFSTETLKARRSFRAIIQTLWEHKCQTSIIYPANLSIIIDGEIKMFHKKTKFKQYLSNYPTPQRILKLDLQHREGNYTKLYWRKHKKLNSSKQT